MYAMIRTSVEVDELDAYSGLRFTCLANLPEGIDGLLVMLIERDGTQYQAVPPPAATDEQQTITIPFEQFVERRKVGPRMRTINLTSSR